ncbi:MAG: tripartite tricarboxylate transporter substrate binding protein, partial [Desulfobacterales bacterium]|nr:tripartite tricarboxylate transporter substrate binding protein [Desulfobacterales bacterium]
CSDYPQKAIEIIVPWGAGGGVDVTTRVFAKHFNKYIDQTMVVLNVTGGGGSVGLTQAFKSKPDGYTLTMAASPLTLHKYTIQGVQYDYSSFEPIGMLTFDPVMFIVKTGSEFDMSFKDFMKYAEENPGKVLYGIAGHWASHDFARAQFELATGLTFQKVFMDTGGALTVVTLLGGHIDICTAYIAEAKSHLDEGTLKVIAVAANERSQFAPDVPTLKELGIDLVAGTWRGILAPKGTPEDVLKVLRDAFKKTTEDPEFLADFEKAGNIPLILEADEFGKLMEEEDIIVQPIIEKIKAELGE